MLELVSYVLPGKNPSTLAIAIEKKLNKKLLLFELDRFLDTETNLKFVDAGKVAKKDIFLIWSFHYGVSEKINNQLFDLVCVISSLKKMDVNKITLISPYLPYTRQEDSAAGLDIGLVSVVNGFLKNSGVSEIIIADIHNDGIRRFSPVLITNIELADFWAEHIKKFIRINKDIVIVSPDKGGVNRIKQVASLLGVEHAYIEKERFAKEQTKALRLHGDVSGKTVILLDDILDTAGTAINASNMLTEQGAKLIYGCFTHGIFSNNSVEKLKNSKFEKIFITNTVSSIDGMDNIVFLSVDDFFANKVLE